MRTGQEHCESILSIPPLPLRLIMAGYEEQNRTCSCLVLSPQRPGELKEGERKWAGTTAAVSVAVSGETDPCICLWIKKGVGRAPSQEHAQTTHAYTCSLEKRFNYVQKKVLNKRGN
ncbi:hypothetical protein AOLI_G00006420 [Acnodon oligacanthus]